MGWDVGGLEMTAKGKLLPVEPCAPPSRVLVLPILYPFLVNLADHFLENLGEGCPPEQQVLTVYGTC